MSEGVLMADEAAWLKAEEACSKDEIIGAKEREKEKEKARAWEAARSHSGDAAPPSSLRPNVTR